MVSGGNPRAPPGNIHPAKYLLSRHRQARRAWARR